MNWMVLPNQVCLIVKLYNNRPGLLPDSNDWISKIFIIFCENRIIIREIFTQTAINRHTAGAVNSPDL